MTDKTALPFVEKVNTRYLETLMGYNARRAALSIIGVFLERMAPFDLRPVDFSVLSLIAHNPGITARQLCATLAILPPNMVGMLNSLEKRGWIERHPHPLDRRAVGLRLSDDGQLRMKQAEKEAQQLEVDSTSGLTALERKTLMQLLKKIYK